MTDATLPQTGDPVRGVLWMLVTGVLFVGVTAAVKHGAADLPAAESAFLRYVLGLVFLLPMLKPLRDAALSRRQVGLFAFRGLMHSLGVMLWFYAMTRITIAEVTAMNYLTPVYVSLGAAVFLGEKLAARRVAAVVVALLGALIILRPGVREITDGHVAMLGTALFFAAGYLTAKRLADEVSALAVVAMLSITVTIGLAPFAWAVWQTPTLAEVWWMFVVACLATAGHYTMTRAFAAAPVSITQPVTFLQLVWATLLGAIVFSEAVDPWVVAGGLIILSSVTALTLREAVLKRRRAADEALMGH